ncbi:MAG TPA: patatin-like phospholipase family protein [Rhodopila sp.]
MSETTNPRVAPATTDQRVAPATTNQRVAPATTNQRVALALQGGGSHGAFTWGVVDRLLEDGQRIDAICGVSSGAMIGAMVTQGLARGGAAAARAEMRRLWQRVADAHALSPWQAAPLERWLFGGWDLSNSMLWQGMEMAMRLFSPAQINPFGHNPMRGLLEDLIEPHLLSDPRAPKLTVAATDVVTGQAAFFGNAAIDADVLCASACLPFVFPAVEIDGRAYWDGGYAGNPPLAPLLRPDPPAELILVRAQAAQRLGVPSTPTEITNRLNEIACQNVLGAELAALPASVKLRTYDADEALLNLPISTKISGEEALLKELFEAGRATGAR